MIFITLWNHVEVMYNKVSKQEGSEINKLKEVPSKRKMTILA